MLEAKEQLHLAKAASAEMRLADTEQKNLFLAKLAELLLQNIEAILVENKKDLNLGKELNLVLLKRLILSESSIKGMAEGLREMIKLPDPVGKIVEEWGRPNGMVVLKKRVPIGVILFVYESRPNVLVDAAGLCVKSGNCLVARGGKEANFSNEILLKFIQKALQEVGLSEHTVQQLEDRSYETLGEVVKMDKYLDLVVPRGREQLINFIKDQARVPVIAHERGLTHLYIDKEANLVMAVELAVNSKVSNPAACNSLEKILIHCDIVDKLAPTLLATLVELGVQVRGDEKICSYNSKCVLAKPEDWNTEYLDLIITVGVVDSFEKAVIWIEEHGSHHTDSIVTEDKIKSAEFLKQVNSAVVMVNASTRLNDGGIFGLGAELGISTSSIHMRGPMGLEDLTVTKYVVLGSGQVRN